MALDLLGLEAAQSAVMIVRCEMALTFPTGCGFRLRLAGKQPLKPWRIVTTHARLAVELRKRTCRHPAGRKHDRLEGSSISRVLEPVNGHAILTALAGVQQACSLDASSPQPGGSCCSRPEGLLGSGLTDISGMVTLALTRKEMLSNPKALEAVKAEGAKVRARKVWDHSSVVEREVLCSQADKQGETIRVADAMTIAGVKNSELPESQHVHKGRVVYRGDAVKDQEGLPAMFRELHSLPTNIQAVSLTLFLGLVEGCVIQTADTCAAFLQAPLPSTTPTWVTLPRELWLPS